MSLKDSLERILTVGIAEELDGVRQRIAPKPETTPPSPTIVDRIPGLNYFGGTNAGAGQPLVMLALLGVAVLGAIYLIRR